MNIPFLRPPFGDAEINAVTKIMRTTALSSGYERDMLEANFAKYIGIKSAIAVCNGTIALDLIWQVYLREKYLKKGDKVLCPSFSFVATANSIVNAGLVPVFCDISEDMWNIDIDKNNKWDDIKAILVVHTFGNPAPMPKICAYADSIDALVVEDCAEACGAEYGMGKVGSFGDAAVFSFNTTKNMTTGEGGMVCFKSVTDTQLAKVLKEHGFFFPVRNAVIPGYNYRLSNIQAVIGIEQLKTLEYRNEKRIFNAEYLTKRLLGLDVGIKFQNEWDNAKHVHQIFAFLVPEYVDRNQALEYLIKNGIEAKNYFDPPIHCQKAYNNKYYPLNQMKNTDWVSKSIICLPFDDKLHKVELDYMVDILEVAMK